MDNLVSRIKETAKNKGMTVKTLSEKANIGPRTISNWKSHKPNTETLDKVATILGVTTDYLLGNTDEKFQVTSSDIDIEEVLSVDYLQKHSVSFGGKPMTEHDAKAIIEVYRAMHEGRD